MARQKYSRTLNVAYRDRDIVADDDDGDDKAMLASADT
jgi:hypothetical protein